MKLLLLTHHWKPYTIHSKFSGYERLAHYLDKKHDVTVLTWRFGKPDPEHDLGLDVKRVFTSPTDVVLERRLLISLSALFEGGNYDIIHALYPETGFFPALKFPTVATVHVTRDFFLRNVWYRYVNLIQRGVFSQAEAIIALSTNLKELLQNKYKVENPIYIPHGVDTDHFSPSSLTDAVEEFKVELIGKKYELIILCIGFHGTNISTVIKLAKEFPEALFIVIGPFSQRSFPSNMKFYSNLSEPEFKKFYDVADLFFRPLKFAVANNSILEAMAMGKPIITDKIPGVIDYLTDDCAYLVEKKDYEAQFRRAIDDEKERAEKGLAARKRAEEKFSWEVVAKQIIEVYDAVSEAHR